MISSDTNVQAAEARVLDKMVQALDNLTQPFFDGKTAIEVGPTPHYRRVHRDGPHHVDRAERTAPRGQQGSRTYGNLVRQDSRSAERRYASAVAEPTRPLSQHRGLRD